MITLRVNPYNDTEIAMLAIALTKAETVVKSVCKGQGDCRVCRLKHVCYDLSKAREHAEQLVTGGNVR